MLIYDFEREDIKALCGGFYDDIKKTSCKKAHQGQVSGDGAKDRAGRNQPKDQETEDQDSAHGPALMHGHKPSQ
ncbi:MAG: hypothetical protein PHW33_04570 [Candidatus Portnoybacteria bacterium]|nr:hypothetical protein [Candidatus Portnoybacteria bacterium]